MKNIEPVNPFKTQIIETNLGKLTRLVANVGVSGHGSLRRDDKALLASYVYGADETYQTVYTLVDTEGSAESFVEENGILPTLFMSPSGENYVSMVRSYPDKEQEVSLPVFNREQLDEPVGKRPFLGKFIGVSNQYSLFHDVDPFAASKPDKLTTIEFKNNLPHKRQTVKVPLPGHNKTFVSNNEIHLLSQDGPKLLHRQIDEAGIALNSREIIASEGLWVLEILSLSYVGNSQLLAARGDELVCVQVSADGQLTETKLTSITGGLYGTWPPVEIAAGTYVTRFTYEQGNGWLTTQNGELVELICRQGSSSYKNLLTDEVAELDSEGELAIGSISKTKDNSYAVVFYHMNDRQAGSLNKELLVLNRQLEN